MRGEKTETSFHASSAKQRMHLALASCSTVHCENTAAPGRNRRRTGLFIGLVLFALVFALMACQKSETPALPAEKQREFANVLYNQQLFRQAVEAYREYLTRYALDDREKANVSYQIANIYFDRLHDYENALAYYLRIRYLYPSQQLENEVNKKIVACLERLQRSIEAQEEIAQASALDESQKPTTRPGEVIAKIGQRRITSGDLQYELNRLPVYLQQQFQNRQSKLEFLKQYIAQELLYDSAKRQGLDKDPEVVEGVLQAQKALMAQKLLEKEIAGEKLEEKYSNADVELYFKANKEKYAEKDKNGKVTRIPQFSEVAEQVARDFMQAKQQEAYQRLIDRLMKAEQVEIYENKFK